MSKDYKIKKLKKEVTKITEILDTLVTYLGVVVLEGPKYTIKRKEEV